MTEMLVVMAIMTVLAASLIVLVPGLRTAAMVKGAQADIQRLSTTILEFKEDRGYFPFRQFTPVDPAKPVDNDYMDYVLYKSLTDPNYDPAGSGTGKGWGFARDDLDFIRPDSKMRNQFVDPWGLPYYYIPNNLYLLGVRISKDPNNDPRNVSWHELVNCYGNTPEANDYRGFTSLTEEQQADVRKRCFNATTFQIFSCGPDMTSDRYDRNPSTPDQADPFDRGCDPDDINNYGGGQ